VTARSSSYTWSRASRRRKPTMPSRSRL
jgi:hypothetical protein